MGLAAVLAGLAARVCLKGPLFIKFIGPDCTFLQQEHKHRCSTAGDAGDAGITDPDAGRDQDAQDAGSSQVRSSVWLDFGVIRSHVNRKRDVNGKSIRC